MRPKNAAIALGSLLALALVGCGGEELVPPTIPPPGPTGPADSPATPAAPAAALSLLTFNAGMARGAVALAEERLEHVIDALAQTTADVVCLQEVWTDSDAQEILDGLDAIYPYGYREKTTDTSSKSVPCSLWGTYKLDGCVKDKCTPNGISAEECVTTSCASEYQALSESCRFCLAANTASPVWCAVWPGAHEFAWEGRNGLLLLSRKPIEAVKYTAFDTVLVKRGVITARIQGTTVSCTHLSSDLTTVPYPTGRRLRSWREEQAEQVTQVQALSPTDRCAVLLGDLNTGPAAATLAAEVAETYQALTTSAGFSEPWADRRCTWCKDNPLAGSSTDRQLDHVMIRRCSGVSARYQRVLDAAVEVTSGSTTHTTRLSDHYGLLLELKPTQSAAR